MKVYANSIVEFAIRWADAIEAELAVAPKFTTVKTINECAARCQDKANTDDITLAMLGVAGQLLCTYWIYGEVLMV